MSIQTSKQMQYQKYHHSDNNNKCIKTQIVFKSNSIFCKKLSKINNNNNNNTRVLISTMSLILVLLCISSSCSSVTAFSHPQHSKYSNFNNGSFHIMSRIRTSSSLSSSLNNNNRNYKYTHSSSFLMTPPISSSSSKQLFQRYNHPISTTSNYNHHRQHRHLLFMTPDPIGSSSSTKTTTTTTTTSESSSSNSIVGQVPTVIFPTPNPSTDEIYSRAIRRTLQWVGLSALFGISLAFLPTDLVGGEGLDTSSEFFAGYLVEQSLSIDNLFVFLLLFDYFQVPLVNQDRVLNYGIYGAIVMRALMIGLGSVALSKFHSILLIFAGILVYSSASVLVDLFRNSDLNIWKDGGDDGEKKEEEEEDMSQNQIVLFANKLFDSTNEFDGDRFFTIVDGVKKATPLFICLVAVEISDVVFAVDSIPAVFGVTENPLIVFSSNMFAIMGLRSLYTILSKAASDLEYLEPAVAFVLGFIGSKMVAEYFGYSVSTEFSLLIVTSLLATGVGLSLVTKDQKEKAENALLESNSTSE